MQKAGAEGTYRGLHRGRSRVGVALDLVTEVLGGRLLRVGLQTKDAQHIATAHEKRRVAYLQGSTGLVGERLTHVVGHDGS